MTRLCRRCALLVPETEFPEGTAWVCCHCLDQKVEPAMPLREHAGHERYDTSQVFAGYRVVKVRQGSGRDQYEVEVPSQDGEFFPVAEAAVGLYTKNATMANKLVKQFPAIRLMTRGDDGRCVLHFPVGLFPLLAKRCGAFKSRVGLPRSDKQIAAQQAAAARLSEARASKPKQLALDV